MLLFLDSSISWVIHPLTGDPALSDCKWKQDKKKDIDKKELAKLVSKGKKQGYLTYDQINEVIPEDMLSTDQIDETLMILGDLDIDIVDERKVKVARNSKKTEEDACL